VVKQRKGAGALGFSIVRSPEELVASCAALARDDLVYDRRPLVQEYVPGEVHDVGLLFNRGEPRAILTQRRLRMYPAEGGRGIHNETTDEPELRELAVALLRELRWHGPAAVEFKVDSRTGTPVFMEINGRIWGTLALAIEAGVNFPLLVCRMAIDGDVEPVLRHRVGLRYRWLLPAGVQYIRDSDRPWREAWHLIRRDRDCRSDFWLSDPLPNLAALLGLVTDRRVRRPAAPSHAESERR
jgi:predicted ATP-grasp superfamily ATP-dependent carboligase